MGPPTDAQLNWVKANANPFWTEDPTVDPADMWPLTYIVGDAHIVGLGEATHGTSEFFKMKHRTLEYLVTRMGFNIFAIEANMPEAYRLNDYMLNGNGDPKKLLAGMYFWTWNTQEVLDMIQWMRSYNQSGQGTVQFTGFDMQYGGVAMDNVAAFVARADPDFIDTANQAFAVARPVTQAFFNAGTISSNSQALPLVHAVWQHLTDRRADYLANFPVADVDWAIQNARIVEQSIQAAGSRDANRDAAMAENIDWIMRQNPGAKAVLWAHDGHIARTAGAMGSYVAAGHGSDYLPIGQVFHSGRYNAIVSGRDSLLTTRRHRFRARWSTCFTRRGCRNSFWMCEELPRMMRGRHGSRVRYSIGQSARSRRLGFL